MYFPFSWCFTIPEGLHTLVVTPSIHYCMAWLGISISAFTEFMGFIQGTIFHPDKDN